MASPTSMSVVAVLLLALLAAAAAQPAPACYTRVFSFGDSLADTGNYRFVYGDDDPEPGLRLPYGETFFHNATGRFSNGRLIIDFIAEALGLPYVRAYLSGWSVEDFAFGANFAVGGAMALSMEFFSEHGVTLPKAYVDLDTQMDWFRFLLQSLCPDNLTDCADMMSKSLFLVGEIGGNDFNQPFLAGVPFEKIRTFTPSVVAKISSTITELIGLGAKTLLVPGNLPVGCTPYYLMTFKSDKAEDYEPRTGCIRWMNEFAQYHNKLLVGELEKLRKLHPSVAIIYGDYYGAAMEIFLPPKKNGIQYSLVACCGGGGSYGVSTTAACGSGEYKVCNDPQNYGSWDGFHPSEASYKFIAGGLLSGSYTQPSVFNTTNSCPRLIEIVSSVEYKRLYDL